MNRTRNGFTLLELLTVMMIGMILMGISAAAYFGMVRSGSMAGAVSSVRTVLELARQHAITCRRRSYVRFDATTGNLRRGRICIAEHVGRNVGGQTPSQFKAEIIIGSAGQYNGSRIFNIDSGEMGKVTSSGNQYLYATNNTGNSINWAVGDRCALLIHDWSLLPEGVIFMNLPNRDLIYNQDGGVPDWNGNDFVIEIHEDAGSASAEIRVQSISGFINVVRGVVN